MAPFARTLPVALLACTAPLLYAQGKVVEKNYSVGGHAELQLTADDASIHAASCGSCTAVRVRVDFHDADPERYDLKQNQSGNTVRFELKRKPFGGWFHGWSRGPEITVEVPTETDANLSTGSGSVYLGGVHGRQELHSGSGSITGEQIDGALKADTGSGSLHLRSIHGDLGAQTGSGTIDADGSVVLHRLSTGSGSIHLALAQGSTIQSGALIEAGSGSIDIRVAPSTRANLEVNTGSGSIHSDLPITVRGDVDKHTLTGTLNGGGPSLRVTTGSGSVALRSL
ncbi:DUF4097 family beta strand repeat-containing protein [Terriglobus aquaticus]|uniref:DUF4097 domain-containing protein n=1 Tax=Terriglobus aquaticus TaxID=940139 RepID=A0ABW9KGU9_9BACT|nr:DUF4097 domain-containing protein [Terriglobus aquaticus]